MRQENSFIIILKRCKMHVKHLIKSHPDLKKNVYVSILYFIVHLISVHLKEKIHLVKL